MQFEGDIPELSITAVGTVEGNFDEPDKSVTYYPCGNCDGEEPRMSSISGEVLVMREHYRDPTMEELPTLGQFLAKQAAD